MTAARAYAAVPEVRTPLHAGVEAPSPLVAFGSNIVFGTHRSRNGGATWSTDAALSGVTWSYVGNGNLAGYVTSPTGATTAVVYTVATGKSVTYALPSSPSSMTDTTALLSGWPNYLAYDLATGASTPIADAPTNIVTSGSWPQLMGSGGVLWRGYSDSFESMYAVAPTFASAPEPWVLIGDIGSVVTRTQLLYAHQNGTTVEICARDLTDLAATPACAAGLTGVAPSMTSAQFFTFGATAVVSLSATTGATTTVGRTFLWNGSSLKRLAVPAGMTISQPSAPSSLSMSYGDTPYLVLRDANSVPSVMTVAPNGMLKRGFHLPRVGASPVTLLAVAPDRVVGSDARDGSDSLFPTWVRPVSGSGFAAETLLPGRGRWVGASAGRTLVSDMSVMTVYDRGVAKASLSNDAILGELSGPYFTRQYDSPNSSGGIVEVFTVDGTSVKSFANYTGDLFGSRYVEWTPGSPFTVTIDDLTGASLQRALQLTGDTTSCYGGQVWGDTLFLGCGDQVRAFSLVDGTEVASVALPAGGWGNVVTAGDGYAILSTDNTAYSLWSLATGSLTPLTGCTDRIATDGAGHVVCATATDLVWRDFSALSTSAPRLLGTMAKASVGFATSASWSLALDTTKALKAGSVVISDASGNTVRSLVVAASGDGSVRVAWNGLDATGKPVPAGTYTYRLVASGADGSGAVVQVTGTGAVQGTVTVTSSACQDRPDAARGCHR